MHINGHFGCGILVKEEGFSPFFDIKNTRNTDSESEDETQKKAEPVVKPWQDRAHEENFDLWTNHRSFFFSFLSELTFDFNDHKHKLPAASMVQGKVTNFDLKFKEMKVYSGHK